jgi:hypothetical protein
MKTFLKLFVGAIGTLYILGLIQTAWMWFMGLPFVTPIVFLAFIMALFWFLFKLWEM